jgi:hypothetical protein
MEWRQTGIDFSFISLFVALLRFIRLGNFHQFPSTIASVEFASGGVFDGITKLYKRRFLMNFLVFLFAIYFHQQTYI